MDLTAYERITRRLMRIEAMLKQLTQRQEIVMADLSALQAEVTRNTEVDQSAITLLNGLAAQIESLKTDPAALQALADSIRSSSDDLAAAVAANTPAQP
jgi:prefoldin subunit 5